MVPYPFVKQVLAHASWTAATRMVSGPGKHFRNTANFSVLVSTQQRIANQTHQVLGTPPNLGRYCAGGRVCSENKGRHQPLHRRPHLGQGNNHLVGENRSVENLHEHDKNVTCRAHNKSRASRQGNTGGSQRTSKYNIYRLCTMRGGIANNLPSDTTSSRVGSPLADPPEFRMRNRR